MEWYQRQSCIDRLPMIEIQDVIDMANFYKISEFDLFYLSFLWWYARMPDESILQEDFKHYLIENKIPAYVKQFIIENPLIDDNGMIVEEWLSILESLRNRAESEIFANAV